MYELLHIPMPPIPEGLTGMLVGLGIVVVGLALLMLGWLLWRALATVMLAGAGLAAGAVAASYFHLPAFWAMAIGAVLGAVAGLLLASMVWAICLGGLISLASVLGEIRVLRAGGREDVPAGFSSAGSFAEWLSLAGRSAWEWLCWLFGQQMVATILALMVPLALGLVMGILRPIFTRVLASSLLGACLAVSGAIAVVVALKPELNVWSGYGPALILGVLLLMWIIGVVYQYRMERIVASRYAKAKEKPAKPDKSDDED